MNRVKLIFLTTFLLFSNQAFSQSIESPEVLGKTVFEALSQKDSVIFKRAVTDKADLKFAIQRIMKKTDREFDEKRIEESYSIYRKYIILSFLETIKEGEKEGINWSEITYSNTSFYERPDSNPDFLEIGKTYLEFNYLEKHYIVKIGDSIKIKGNWTIEDSIYWEGEKKD